MTGTQEFERVLDDSDKSVASFEHENVSLCR
jgi:fructose transport system permease protein